ncbi:hypothetical protein P3375_25695 [Vibrio parahaemolyticus]|nr:hypothetical protein [Vibrio parahaemolyticus]
MADFLPDFDFMEEEFDFAEFDGRPYLFEPEYTDEELREIEERRKRDDTGRGRQRRNGCWKDLALEIGGVPVNAVPQCPQKGNASVARNGTGCSLS